MCSSKRKRAEGGESGTRKRPCVVVSDQEESSSSEDAAPRETVVASFDLGENATAYCVGAVREGESGIRIVGIGLAALGKVGGAHRAVRSIWDMFARLPRADVYLVEEQPPINRRTCMMETALATLAISVAGGIIVHVPTSRITTAYNLPYGRAQKKKAGVACAATILRSLSVSVTDGVASVFHDLKRQHDMADAIMQLHWYVTIGRNEIDAGGVARNPKPWKRSVRATAAKNAAAERRKDETRRRHAVGAIAEAVGGRKRRKTAAR
jgi:hypothetical protein